MYTNPNKHKVFSQEFQINCHLTLNQSGIVIKCILFSNIALYNSIFKMKLVQYNKYLVSVSIIDIESLVISYQGIDC